MTGEGSGGRRQSAINAILTLKTIGRLRVELYFRSSDIWPPKSPETRPVCGFTVAVPVQCCNVAAPTKRDPPRAVAQQYGSQRRAGGTNLVMLSRTLDQRVRMLKLNRLTWSWTWTCAVHQCNLIPPMETRVASFTGHPSNAPTYPGGHSIQWGLVAGEGRDGRSGDRRLASSPFPISEQTVIDDDYITTAPGNLTNGWLWHCSVVGIVHSRIIRSTVA